MQKIQSICVYCGSSPGTDPAYVDAARMLGTSMANAGIRLVYGGGDRGIMGEVASAVHAGDGVVMGVIPEFLLKLERDTKPFEAIGELVVVADMHTRKQRMFEEADAFVALPGGIGTLEELVEILTWSQLGRHDKPIVLANISHFWQPFEQLLDGMETSGFLHTANRARPLIVEDAGKIVATIEAAAGGS